MESGSHNHNEIVLEVPEGSSLPDQKAASDAQEAVTLSAGPIGCNRNEIGALNHNEIVLPQPIA
ncbi:hypothetical protein [Streptomyces sp. NPDC018833]|uniref:hypothetical protein n=1 Tax=Streptomyces sp. NPDC018833 TaxID=3365053 RepID=UPI00378BE452